MVSTEQWQRFREVSEDVDINSLKPVYHGEHGTRSLKELMRTNECMVKDLTRLRDRLKALYNGRAIPNG